MSGQQAKNNSLSSNLSNLSSGYQNNSQFGQNVWKGQQPFLQQLYQQAGDLFKQTQGSLNQQIPGVQDYMKGTAGAANTAWQDQLGGGAYSGVNAGDIYNQLTQSMGKPSETSGIYAQMMGGQGNNYADAMKAQYMKDANRAQGQMLSNLDARAAAAGSSGSSRHGVAQGLGMQGINDSLQAQLAKTGYETFDKDLQNKLGIAQMADSNTLARQGMLQQMLQGKQGAMSGGMQMAPAVQNLGMGQLAPNMMNWQNFNQYASGIGGPLVLNSGTNTGSGNALGSSYGTSSASGKSGGGGLLG